jgi:group I intron endonuclease
MFVYLIVNHVTSKIYVGKHTGKNLRKYLQQKLSQAWYELKRGKGSSILFNSMRKHPKDAWSIHPLISDCQTNDELCHWEQTLIKALAAQNPEVGYNICRGGEGFSGPHSPETRQKIADASHEMWLRPEIRENFSEKMLGKPSKHTSEGKEAIRQAHLGKKASSETIQRLSLSHMGIRRSPESREKQRQSVTGSGNHFFGKKHSMETRRSMKIRAVRCVDTNEVFSSFAHVLEKFGGNKSNLSRAIKRGHKFSGSRFEYAQ